ncbi:Hypothetical protein POVR1_LOCUS419 [uncultured virus]|nr:Hypothetical protein POVR1_LOCUS419 [uncultured virus]
MELMFLPYDSYLQIRMDRFYEVIPYDESLGSTPLVSQKIIEDLKKPPVTSKHYSFTRLTAEEIQEYLLLHAIKFRAYSYFAIKVANRCYCYDFSRGVTEYLTPAVQDLIHLSKYDPDLHRQYRPEDIDAMNNTDFLELARKFHLDREDPNLEDRLRRMLRMGLYFRIA